MNILDNKEKIRIYSQAVKNVSVALGHKQNSPTIIAWILTKRCNLTCKHCNSHLDRNKINGKNLMRLAGKIAESNAVIVVLSGGEPLLVPNIEEIILKLKSSGKKVILNTNGYNIDEHFDFLLSGAVDNIAISFDGLDAQSHDTIRGKQGAFQKTLDNLVYLKNNRKNSFPRLSVRAVIMKDNFQQMTDYCHFFQEIADDIKFQPVHNYEGFDQVVDKSVLFDGTDLVVENEFEFNMKTLTSHFPEYDNFYYKNFKKFLFHPEEMEVKSLHHCLPVWMNYLCILNDGTCRSCAMDIGNLYHEDVHSIWNGKLRIEYLRSLAKNGKCKVPCWLNCTGVAPEWQGRILKNLLKVGAVSEEGKQRFMQTANYTGVETENNFEL